MIKLSKGKEYEIEECNKCCHKMINVDAEEITQTDLILLRNNGIRVSNSNTEDLICLNCHAQHFIDWYKDKKDANNDHDSSLNSLRSIGGFFGGGFGGGSFSGAGASSKW
jgi:uncharacterized membrane protein YgcG